MAVELFDNEFITNLTADINAAQVTIPVAAAASAALQAAGGQFRIIVDAERMLVTAGANSTTWTVTRGIENTGPAAHTSSTMVAHILTVGGFLNHHTIHEPGGADPFTKLDDTNFAAVAKDGLAARASLRTLGAGAQQAAAGNDARFSDARTPTAHASTHKYNGSDPLYSLTPTSKSANYTAVIGDLVLMSGSFTVTLPTSPTGTPQIGVVAVSGNVSITRGGTNTISVNGLTGQTTFTIPAGASVILAYLSGVWYALQSVGPGGAGGTNLAPVAASADVTAATNQLILMTGAHVVTLPSAPTNGTQVGTYALTAACSMVSSGTDVIEFSGPSSSTVLTVPSGTEYVLEYYNGVWYGAGAISSAFTPPARAYRNTAFSLTAGSYVKIPLDTKSYDPGGNIDVTTNQGRYTCPSAGYYAVNAEVSISASASGQRLIATIYKNGVEVSSGSEADSSGTSQSPGAVYSDVIQCNAGDYLEFYVYCSAAQPLNNLPLSNYMTVYQVGQIGTAPPGQGIATQARAYRNAAYTMVASAWTALPFDSESFDPGSNFNTGTNRYVCPTTGYYEVEGAAAFTSTAASQTIQAAIYKNGALVSSSAPGVSTASGQSIQGTVGDIVQCNAGDYLQLFYFVGTAFALAPGANLTYLSISQIAGSNIVGALSPTAQSAPYTAGPGQLVLMTGANAVTLPSAPQSGSQVQVTALTASVPVNRSSADTINNMGVAGVTSLTVNSGQSIVFSYLGGVWYASPTGGGSNLAPPARASQGAAQNLVAATWTKVNLDTKTYDSGGNYDATNKRYVVPVAGIYEVNATVSAAATAAGQTMNCAIYKNGTIVTQGPQIEANVAGTLGANVADFVQCNAGDLLEVYALSSAALAITVSTSATWMSIAQTGMSGTPSPGQGQATLARAYRNAVWAIPAAAWTKMPIDTVSFDPGNNFSVANNRYICPTTGYYAVDGELFLAAGANSQTLLTIYKNGVEVSRGDVVAAAANQSGFSISDVIQCNAGDYLEIYAYSTNGQSTAAVGGISNRITIQQIVGTNLIGALSPTAQTANYSAGAGQLVIMTGQNTVTLPSAPMNGSQVGVNALTGTVPIVRAGTDTINFNGTSGQTSINAPVGATVVLTYLNGVWYGAGPTQATLAPPARAHRVAALTPGTSTQKIPLDTKSYDPGGIYDIANTRFVVPNAGMYEVTAAISMPAGSVNVQPMIYKNGAIVAGGTVFTGGANGGGGVMTDTLQCNAGDYIEFYCWFASSQAITPGITNTFMSVVQVMQTGATQQSPGQGIATQARAYRNAAITLTATTQKIPLDTVSYDPGSNFNLANNRYVCPVTGYYEVQAEIAISGSMQCQPLIFKNGVTLSGGVVFGGSANGSGGGVSDIVFCQAGDYLEFYVWVLSTATANVGPAYTYMSVIQIAGANTVGALSPTAQTADYTAGPGQSVLMTGAHNHTLPNAPQNGTEEEVVALTRHVTVLRQGIDTITYGDSGLTKVMVPQGSTFTFRYLSGVWYVVGMPQGNTDDLQNGVVNAGDLAVTGVTITAGTGAITFTVASGIAWVRTNNGILVRVPVVGQSFTLSPASLPAAGQYAVIGIELAQSGNVLLSAKGTDTATNLNTAALVASNSPAVTGGRMRIWDVSIGNAAGVYSLVGQIDRRPWARGAFYTGAPGGWVLTNTSAWTNTGIAARLECTGMPVECKIGPIQIRMTAAPAYGTYFGWSIDGAAPSITEYVLIDATSGQNQMLTAKPDQTITPSAGSHLITLQQKLDTATVQNIASPYWFSVEEKLRQNINNGVA